MTSSFQVPGRYFQQQNITGDFQVPARAFAQQSIAAGTWKTTVGLSVASGIKTDIGLALSSIKTSDGLTPR